jgi:hypothetical protein
MKLDPGMHIGLHLVFFGKTGVTAGRRHIHLSVLHGKKKHSCSERTCSSLVVHFRFASHSQPLFLYFYTLVLLWLEICIWKETELKSVHQLLSTRPNKLSRYLSTWSTLSAFIGAVLLSTVVYFRKNSQTNTIYNKSCMLAQVPEETIFLLYQLQ